MPPSSFHWEGFLDWKGTNNFSKTKKRKRKIVKSSDVLPNCQPFIPRHEV